MTTEAQPDYLAYLLRLWRVNAAANTWRASLEEPHTGEQRAFASLEALFDFLRAHTGLSLESDTSRVRKPGNQI
jgi:hypothetical protein